MRGTLPPGPSEAARKLDRIELRIETLRLEIEATTGSEEQAALLYELGSLYEHQLGRPQDAVAQYKAARDRCADFQPAWLAEARLIERIKGKPGLEILCTEQAESAESAALEAAALLDVALCSADWPAARNALRESIALAPRPTTAALILEWLADAQDDREAQLEALTAQAKDASEPTLQAALFLDLALCQLDLGRTDEALQSLESASASPALTWQARNLQVRVARSTQRWPVFIRAATELAKLLEAADHEPHGPPDPLAVPTPAEDRLCLAALLWQEAAQALGAHEAKPLEAVHALGIATRYFPDDQLLRQDQLRWEERAGLSPDEGEASHWFRELAADDPFFVAQEIRRALTAESSERAAATLRTLAARHPDSALAAAAWDVALCKAGAHAERANGWVGRAQNQRGERRARLLWRAAQTLSEIAEAEDEALELYRAAAEAADVSRARVLREAYGLALRTKRFELAAEFCEALLDFDLDEAEQSALLHSRYTLTAELGLAAEARAQLSEALNDGAAEHWAPFVARAQAVSSSDPLLLARAHEALCEKASESRALAHLCAAGRAYAQARSWEGAERVLRQALELRPEDAYASAMLLGVLRDSGELEQMMSLAEASPDSLSEPEQMLRSLLRAGEVAERASQVHTAQRAYEEAIRIAPGSTRGAQALLELGRRHDLPDARATAYATLSATATDAQTARRYAMLRADALDLGLGQSQEAATLYESALAHEETALSAALALLTMPQQGSLEIQRAEAYALLSEHIPLEHRMVFDEDAMRMAMAEVGEAEHSFATRYLQTYRTLEAEEEAGEAWLSLADLAPSDALTASVRLQGLRVKSLLCGAEAADELFMLAQQTGHLADETLEAATVVDEALGPGDDAELRADALQHRLQHAGALTRAALDAAHCRALIDADRGAQALPTLLAAADERPEDLSLWESLRSAARQAGQWALVARACEHLANVVTGTLRADLLEEAGSVRLDYLAQETQAEDLFRRALREHPEREVAFRRLHDLLARKQDTEGLDALVAGRLQHLGDHGDRLRLLYERARLLRGFSDRKAVLEVLADLFAMDPEHEGALALAAEVHASEENWEEAVRCLQRLAHTDITSSQKRLARLGAADFLERHVAAPERALAELRAVEAMDLADAADYRRIAKLERSLGHAEAAAAAFMQAFQQTEGETAAGNAVAAARLYQELGDLDRSTEWFNRAARAEPTCREAVEGQLELLEGTKRRVAIDAYERAQWERIETGALDGDTLLELRRCAQWREEPERLAAVDQCLAAVSLKPSADGDAPALMQRLSTLSADVCLEADSDPVLEELLASVGPALVRAARWMRGPRSNLAKNELDALEAELRPICERLQLRLGSSSVHAQEHVEASLSDATQIDWLVPETAGHAFDAMLRFRAGRIAWATPRGAATLLDAPAQSVGAHLAAVLRSSGCRVEGQPAPVHAVELKLPRSLRRRVGDLLGDRIYSIESLEVFARTLQRDADRVGLLLAGDLAAALRVIEPTGRSIEDLGASPRARQLMHFWLAADSPLWKASHD